MLRGARHRKCRILDLTQLVTAALLVGVVAGCGGSAAAGSSAAAPARSLTRAKVSRIVVVVLENREYNEIIGRASAPYINSLAGQSAVATDYHAVSHPSLPNYLALTGGSTFGFDGSDCMTCSVSHRNLIDQLEASKISWKAYMEDMPSACSFASSSGGYVRRHDPFMYYRDVAGNRNRCRFVVPANQLGSDLARHSLPEFV